MNSRARIGRGIALLAAAAAALAGCSSEPPVLAEARAGDAERGRVLLRQYGCTACHSIPGVAAASGNAGPPLDGIARRAYLGGVVPNWPDNMAQWILNPQRFDPLTAMPATPAPEEHVRDMIAHLYTLR